jgi:hypothetical protein
VGATAGLDHLFLIRIPGKKMAFGINPAAYTHFGTQNFTDTYYQQKRIFNILPVDQEAVTKNSRQFNVLSYEFSLPVVFVAGKYNFSLAGNYVMPQHLVQGAETGENMFYVSAGVGVRL